MNWLMIRLMMFCLLNLTWLCLFVFDHSIHSIQFNSIQFKLRQCAISIVVVCLHAFVVLVALVTNCITIALVSLIACWIQIKCNYNSNSNALSALQLHCNIRPLIYSPLKHMALIAYGHNKPESHSYSTGAVDRHGPQTES